VSPVEFSPAAYASPTNNVDTALGNFNGWVPIEPYISVNPADPANVAVTSHVALRISTNGGGSFSSSITFTNPPSTNTFAGDTGTVFNSTGRLFWSNMAGVNVDGVSVNERNRTTGALVSGSNVNVASTDDDKDFITSDNSPTSPFENNLYVVWTTFGTNPAQIRFSRSTNFGLTWSSPLTLSASSEGFVWPVTVRTAANGDVYVAYHSQPNFYFNNPDGTSGQTYVLRSTNGGMSFPQKNLAFTGGQGDISFNVQTTANGSTPGPGAISQTQFWTQGSAQPWVLPDPIRPGNVYVVAADDPNNVHGTAGDDMDVVFARSTNNGASWTQTTLPFNPPGGSHQFFPTAAIDQFGDIAVAWYDTRRGIVNANNRLKLDVFASYSRDGGLTWANPFMINDPSSPFDPDIGAVNRFVGPPVTTRIGEYFGIDLFANTVHLAWNGPSPLGPATQTGQQVVYDKFAIPGTVTINGDQSGSAINDSFVLDRIPGSSEIEVTVNGVREYAGLPEGLSLVINGLGGNDTLTVDYANGNPIPAGGLSFSGGAGTDKLIIHGGGATVGSYTPDGTNGAAGQIVIGTSTINFDGLESATPVELDGFASSSTFTVTTPNSADAVTADAAPDGRFRVSGNSGGIVFVPILVDAGKLIVDTGANDGASPADSVIVDLGGLTPSAGRECVVNTGAGSDSINIRSLASAALATINAGADDDVMTVDSNGSDAGGTVDLIQGQITVNGQGGNDSLTLENSSDTTADTVNIDPAQIGATGSFFGTGGSLSYTQVASITLNLSNGSMGDVVNVIPSATTILNINGDDPTTTTGIGDQLSVDLTGTTTPTQFRTTSVNGHWAFGNRQPIYYTSFEQVDAPPTAIIQVNDGTPQRSRVTSITVTFSQPVTFPNGLSNAIMLQRTGPGGPTGFVSITYTPSGNSVVLSFADPTYSEFTSLVDGRYALTLVAAQIQGAGGILDGNADGAGGDDYVEVGAPGSAHNLFRLYGDINGDGTVSASDFIQFRQFFGGSNFAFDFDNDGAVASSDFIQFRLRFGGSI
jgi:hypothetical protein